MNTVSKKLMIAIASLTAPMMAAADTVVETFSGTITGGETVDVQGIFGSPLTNLLGDAYTATFEIDGPSCGGPGGGACGGAGGANFAVGADTTSFTLTINGHAFSPPLQSGGQADFGNTAPNSSVSLSAYGELKANGEAVTMMYQVASGNFPSPLIYGVPFAFHYAVNPATDSASGEIDAHLLDGGFDATLGVSSMNVSYVPLPAAVWMLLGALGGLGAFVRRHRPPIRASA